MRNQLIATIFMSITDQETFETNESGTVQMSRTVVVTDDHPTDVIQMLKAMGGERRVELKLKAQSLTNGDVRIDGQAKLYEGTSVYTGDLDGETLFTLLAPKNRLTSRPITVRNDDQDRDFAHLIVSFNNRPLDAVLSPPQEVQRRLNAAAFLRIVDQETFDSNEAGTANLVREAVVTSDHPAEVIHFQKGGGREVRVELDLKAMALINGDIRVEGEAKLFAGTSEHAGDLAGQRVFTVLVPRDRLASRTVTVRNDDEGGDFATISLNFRNQAV